MARPMEDQNYNQALAPILKELSDIKTSLAVNTNETKNTKDVVGEIRNDVKETKQAVAFQNGRVRTLEDWSKEVQKIIEHTTTIATDTYNNYKTDKAKIWAAVGVLLFLGGTIITLSIMAINSKIKDGYSSPEVKQIIKQAVLESLEENVTNIEKDE